MPASIDHRSFRGKVLVDPVVRACRLVAHVWHLHLCLDAAARRLVVEKTSLAALPTCRSSAGPVDTVLDSRLISGRLRLCNTWSQYCCGCRLTHSSGLVVVGRKFVLGVSRRGRELFEVALRCHEKRAGAVSVGSCVCRRGVTRGGETRSACSARVCILA